MRLSSKSFLFSSHPFSVRRLNAIFRTNFAIRLIRKHIEKENIFGKWLQKRNLWLIL